MEKIKKFFYYLLLPITAIIGLITYILGRYERQIETAKRDKYKKTLREMTNDIEKSRSEMDRSRAAWREFDQSTGVGEVPGDDDPPPAA